MKQGWKTIAVVVVAVTLMVQSGTSDPQATRISQYGRECSGINPANPFEFFTNLNATLVDLRHKLSVDKTHFATAQQPSSSSPVYSMVQCRNYLSPADCVSCFDIAALDIRKLCGFNTGARVIYNGCFLRYELRNFYTETDMGLTSEVCSVNRSRSVSAEAAFKLVTVQLLKDLAAATPNIKTYFSVAKRQVFDGGASQKASLTVYALAQCVDTISQGDCRSCLMGLYNQIQNAFLYQEEVL